MSRHLPLKYVAFVSTFSLLASAAADAQLGPNLCAMDGDKLAAEPRQSVVVTDPAVFQAADFSLARTLGAVLATAVAVDPALSPADQDARRQEANTRSEQIALLASLLRSFRLRERVNPDSNVPMALSHRPNEAKLDAVDLLTPSSADGMRPVALFNRLDLAPASWRYCGEHRIVYAMGDGANRTHRFFLIFEAAVDNPDPQNRKDGCVRIARFWDGLRGKTAAAAAPLLARFYFEGDLGDGGPRIQPVVHHQHYGVPFGQVRGNLFVTGGDIDSNPWMLREWRTSLSGDGVATFVADTVKANPDPDLYGPRKPGEAQDFADLRPEFQEAFVIDHVRELIDAELAAQREGRPLPENDLFARLSARFENRFNSFESISQVTEKFPDAEDPLKRAAGTDLIPRVETDLKNFKLPPYAPLTAQHILARAGALSCAGCHDLSVGQEIAPGVKWPAVAGRFTHTTEAGGLSIALEKHFLPARCGNMQDNALKSEATVASAAPSAALSGALTKARGALLAAQSVGSRPERLELLPRLENDVQEARRQDFQTRGAFVPFRRTH